MARHWRSSIYNDGENILNWLALQLKHYYEVRDVLKESITLNVSVSDHGRLGFAYRGLGLIALVQGEHIQAGNKFCHSQKMFAEIGAPPDVASPLAEMSHSPFALGDNAEDERGWRETLHMAHKT